MEEEVIKASQLYIGNKIYIVSSYGELSEDYIENLNISRDVVKVTLSISDYLDFELYGSNDTKYTVRQEEWYNEYFFDEKVALSRAVEKTKKWLTKSLESVENTTKQLKKYEIMLSEVDEKKISQ